MVSMVERRMFRIGVVVLAVTAIELSLLVGDRDGIPGLHRQGGGCRGDDRLNSLAGAQERGRVAQIAQHRFDAHGFQARYLFRRGG